MSESVRSPATATAKGAERAEFELRELRRPKGQAGGRAPRAERRIVGRESSPTGTATAKGAE